MVTIITSLAPYSRAASSMPAAQQLERHDAARRQPLGFRVGPGADHPDRHHHFRIAVVPACVGQSRKVHAVAERLGAGRAFGNGGLIEHAETEGWGCHSGTTNQSNVLIYSFTDSFE